MLQLDDKANTLLDILRTMIFKLWDYWLKERSIYFQVTQTHTHTHTHTETNTTIRKFSEKEVNLMIEIFPAYFFLLCFISLFHFILLGEVYGY